MLEITKVSGLRQRPKPVALVVLAALLGFTAATASAGTVLLVGSNAGTPDQISVISQLGSPLGFVGPHNASAAAVDPVGNMFIAIPGDDSSTVHEYDAAQNLLMSFVFTPSSDTRVAAGFIEDMTWGLGGWLWISTFSGEVYSVSSAGIIQSSFDTGTSGPGVATDGTNLYTTEGFGFIDPAPHFYRRDAAGNILATISTGLNDTLGIGYDRLSNTFWIGGFDLLSNVDGSGNVLNQFAIDGVHTGVELLAVPEPATVVLMGFGMVALLVSRFVVFDRELLKERIAGGAGGGD
jgi:PEP-CTERM motif